MKKQIFILAFFVLALFAGINKSYGQLPARPIDPVCLPNDALHPIPGTPYQYKVVVPDPSPGTAWTTKKYTWFVTQNQKFIEIDPATKAITLNYKTTDGAEDVATSLLMTPTTATDYANPANTTATSIELTWKSFAYDPAKPVFVVINVSGSAVCTDISNLKVFKIEPVFAFTLDIANLTKAGALPSPIAYGTNIDICISPIQSATYKAGALPTDQGTVVYDFGADTLYYEVNAANWYDRWELSTKVTGTAATQTVKLDWAYAPATRPINYKADISTWNVITGVTSDISNPFVSPTLIAPPTGLKAVDEKGQSIIIRLVVNHGSKYEGIADEPITLAVDGVLYHESATTPGTYDVKGTVLESDVNITAGTNLPAEKCPWHDGFVNDVAIQTIKARPNITAPTPATMPVPGIIPID